MEKLPGDYIAGFIDGEGCFSLHLRRDVRHERKNSPIYFLWKIKFSIVLREDDIDILTRIQSPLDCGSVNVAERGFAQCQVADVKDLKDKIVPFFEKNNLQAKKRLDFDLWKEAVAIIFNTKRKEVNTKPGTRGFFKTIWKKEDLDKLSEIQNKLINLRKISKPHKWTGRELGRKLS